MIRLSGIRGKHKNKLMKVSCLFKFRRLRNNFACFFDFYKQHQAEIWFEILIISGIKRSSKKKTCWVNSIIATKFIYYWWKSVLTTLHLQTTCPIWFALFMIFQKSRLPIDKGGGTQCCLKSTIKTPEQYQWHHSIAFNINSEPISHIALAFPLLTLDK